MNGFLSFFCLISVQAIFAGPLGVQIPRAHFVENSPENVKILESNDYPQNAEELSGQFEGDILLNEHQRDYIFFGSRNGYVNVTARWLNNTVPYKLNANHTEEQNEYIRKALDTLASVSCIKFVPYTNETDYIELSSHANGCYSYIGRQGGPQSLNLHPYPVSKGCFRLGTIMHEFLHALGFFHMQSTLDRDDHVKIEWKNILYSAKNNFNKYNASMIADFRVSYDYESILHYSAYGFSINGYATIVPHKISHIKTIGQRENLTPSDILKLNRMYDCDSNTK